VYESQLINKLAFLSSRDFCFKLIDIHILILLFFRAKCNTSYNGQLFAIKRERWPELWATKTLKFDLVQDCVVCLNAKKQAEKYILNMIMVFKVLKIICYSNKTSYEKASLGWNSAQYW